MGQSGYPNPSSSRSLFLKGIVWLACGSFLFSGCATTLPKHPGRDPFEKMNRSFHRMNHKLDQTFMAPVAEAYADNIPKPVQHGVTNFFNNLREPYTIANQILQLKLKYAVHDTGRFVINSTVGIGGILDVAVAAGLKRHKEDLGQTLGVWGFGEGPYLVLLVMGPTTLRDLPDRILGAFSSLRPITNPFFAYVDNDVVKIPVLAVGMIGKRAELIGTIKSVDEDAIDRYVFVREAYRDTRRFEIYDGNPPIEPILDDEIFDDEDEEYEE